MPQPVARDGRSRGTGGFTLVELLVQVVILGALAAVVVTVVGGISTRGEREACHENARVFATTVESYRAWDTAHALPGSATDGSGDAWTHTVSDVEDGGCATL